MTIVRCFPKHAVRTSCRFSPPDSALPWPATRVLQNYSFCHVQLCLISFASEVQSQNPIRSKFKNCWFSHDVTKLQTTKLSILLRFYFHGILEWLKTNFQTNFRFKGVLGFVIEYAWISKLLRDAAFTWRPRELSCRLKKWLISGNFAI